MANPTTGWKPKTVMGEVVMPRIKYEIKVTDGGQPVPPDKSEDCHLCSEAICPFDCFCRDENHPQHPMHISCLGRWLSTLDNDSDTGRCPVPNCTDKHAMFKKNDPDCKVWTFRPVPSPDIHIPTEDANEYARVFLTWMLLMNSFETDSVQNWVEFRDYTILGGERVGLSIMKLQEMKASEWDSMHWAERIEIMAADRIAFHPKSQSWIDAANEGRSLEDVQGVRTRHFMVQLAVNYLLEYVEKLVSTSKITLEKAADVFQPLDSKS